MANHRAAELGGNFKTNLLQHRGRERESSCCKMNPSYRSGRYRDDSQQFQNRSLLPVPHLPFLPPEISFPSYGLSNGSGGSRPSVFITGRPVVILEDALLARVLGRGQSDPFIITRQPPAIHERQTKHWATGGNIVSSLPMAKCQSAITSKHFMHSSSTSPEMVSLPVPEMDSPPTPRHDMAVVPYGMSRSSHHTWEHEFYPQMSKLVRQAPWIQPPSNIPLDCVELTDTLSLTAFCGPAEDTGIAEVPSSPQEVSEGMMCIPESPPMGPSKCSPELQSSPQCPSPINPPEVAATELEQSPHNLVSPAILQDSEGSIQLANECGESNASVWEDVKQLEPEIASNCTTEFSDVCVSPATPQIDQPTCIREEQVTSQYSIGERILRAWTQSIVSMASEEQQQQKASEPDVMIASQQLKTSEPDVTIASQQQKASEPDVTIASQQQKASEPDVTIASQQQKASEPDATIASQQQKASEPDVTIASQQQKASEPDVTIASQQLKTSEPDVMIASQQQQASEPDVTIPSQQQQASELDVTIASQQQQASEPDVTIASQQLKASEPDVMASACQETPNHQTRGLEIHGEKQSPKKVSTIPTVASRPASSSSANLPSTLLPLRAAFVCEEREEQILQESDSEMEMPEELEGPSSLANSHEESSHSETTVTEAPPPPPPPPPPPLQQVPTTTTTEATLETKATITTTAEATIDNNTETEASYKLLNPFHSDTHQSTSAGSLLDFTIAPLGATQLSQSLQFGLQQAGSGSSISDLHAPLLASTCKREASPDVGLGPPEKKLKLSEANDSTDRDSTKQSDSFTIPSESVATVPELRLKTHVPEFEQMGVSGEGHLRDEMMSGLDYPHEGVCSGQKLDHPHEGVCSGQKLDHPHEGVCGGQKLDYPHEGVCGGQKLDHPHEPYEYMDDGLDTVYQAVPTECAREHALIPNPVLCRDDEGSGESHGDSDEGGGGNAVQQVPEEAFHDEEDPREDEGSPPNTVEGRITIELDSAVPSLELEGENPTRDSSDEPLQTTLPEDYEHMTLITTDQQIVPESSLNTSLTAQSLYDEGSGSNKIESKLTGSQQMCSLGDVDVDELDGPTVLAMALDSIECRRKTELVGSAECVHQRSPSRQWVGGYTSTSAGATHSSHDSHLIQTTRLNLARPRLRLGLSKKQRCTPLHQYHFK